MRRLLLVLFILVGASGVAHAYPQFQLSTGAVRCSQCHYSPTGGGLINGYARYEVGEEISTLGGNGDFLHGAVELPAREISHVGAALESARVPRAAQQDETQYREHDDAGSVHTIFRAGPRRPVAEVGAAIRRQLGS